MSTLKANAILDASGGSTATINGVAVTSDNYIGMRNRIINGDMRIDQRNAGASVTPTDNAYTLDRWKSKLSQASKYSVQQSSVAPAKFTNSLLVTSLSAYSITSTDRFGLQYLIEGFNTADFAFGTASAVTITLSFWVRSSLTGTFGGAFFNDGANRSYPFTYSISSANTWEQKTVTLIGDTTGTWKTDNTVGLYIEFSLGTGSTLSGTAGAWAGAFTPSATGATSVVGTNGATFYITGVQLEVGSVATPFERRPYGTELALCQRYCFVNQAQAAYSWFGDGLVVQATEIRPIIALPVEMRTSPSVTTSGSLRCYDGSAANAVTAVDISQNSKISPTLYCTTTGMTTGRCAQFGANNDSTAKLILSAEL